MWHFKEGLLWLCLGINNTPIYRYLCGFLVSFRLIDIWSWLMILVFSLIFIVYGGNWKDLGYGSRFIHEISVGFDHFTVSIELTIFFRIEWCSTEPSHETLWHSEKQAGPSGKESTSTLWHNLVSSSPPWTLLFARSFLREFWNEKC